MKKIISMALCFCTLLVTLCSCNNNQNITTVSANNTMLAADLYSVTSSEDKNENNFELQESFRDDNYWYYIYYLGRVHGIPIGEITSNWFRYRGGAEITKELKITEMTTDKVAISLEKANSVTDGWSKELSQEISTSLSTSISQEIKVGASAELELFGGKGSASTEESVGSSVTSTLQLGFEEKYGINSTKQNTLAQYVENSKEITAVTEKTMTFSFVPNVTEHGFYNYLTLGTADVFAVVIYEPIKRNVSITSVSNWVFLYDELVYSEDEFSANNIGAHSLELPIENISFLEPTTYYKTVNQDQLNPAPDTSEKTVYLNANGGVIAQTSLSVLGNGTYGYLPLPEKSGYVFAGWYTQLNGGEHITADTRVQFSGKEITLFARWTKDSTAITLGSEYVDRHRIRIWNSWGHDENEYGEDTIHTELNRDILKSIGYQKLEVTMTFDYRVDDWGDQLIQIFSKDGGEVKRFEYEWDETGWTKQTVTFEISLADVAADCGFGIKWYLSKDGTNSDTWFVGGTNLVIKALK